MKHWGIYQPLFFRQDKPTIMDVSLTVSQVSRVAVIGANGAGKSTAIKARLRRGRGMVDPINHQKDSIKSLQNGMNHQLLILQPE